MVGFPADKAALDARAGNLAVQLRDFLFWSAQLCGVN